MLCPAIFSIGAVLALFFWQGNRGFSLWDEGFLWYGVQRVMAGEVPIRDFMAYDPGRYYSSALLMRIWGDTGIMALRVVLAVFQAIGLYIALRLLAGKANKLNLLLVILSTIALTVWMFPQHKLFDISLSIVLIGVLSAVIDRPTCLRFFIAGLAVGVIAVFGRNHGLYGAIGSFGVMAYLALTRGNAGFVRAFVTWAAGVIIGYFPVWLMAIIFPGFAAAFLESIRVLLELKTTNLSLPVPWPWTIQFAHMSPIDIMRGVLTGLFFIGVFALGPLGIIWATTRGFIKKPLPAPVTASAFLALPYAHFAYSRADMNHLAQSIFPFLIGILSFLMKRPGWVQWPSAALLTAASLLVSLPHHPGWQSRMNEPWIEAKVLTDTLIMNPDTAEDLALLQKLADDFAPGDRGFIAAPFWPGAYAVLGRKAPMWEIYALFSASETFQRAEIERIERANPGFAIILDVPLDGRDELRFRHTHPLIDAYIRENFEKIATGYQKGQEYQIYKSKRVFQ
jgi:hypothetical protein